MKLETIKTLVIVGLVLVLVAETGYIVVKKVATKVETKIAEKLSGQNPQAPRPALLAKGDKFADSPIFKYAYQIAPGDISATTTAALVGFSITKKTLTDGSIQVTLTPKDADDQFQTYTVKTGETLYFVEMSAGDDQGDTDKNLRDDYGVVVDANGLVIQ